MRLDRSGALAVGAAVLLLGCGASPRARSGSASGSATEAAVPARGEVAPSGAVPPGPRGLVGTWMLASRDASMRFPYQYFALHATGQAYVYRLPEGCRPLDGCEQMLEARWRARDGRLRIDETADANRSWDFRYATEGPDPPAEGTVLSLQSEHRELARYRWTPVE